MKVVLSRKGFDSAAGGAPSPIIDGRPLSMPIPATKNSATAYQDIGLGDVVERITRGQIGRSHLCHRDPMFVGEECVFGQCDTAQSHLDNQGVGVGDVFLFFGLFADGTTGEPHHRFFGHLDVAEKTRVADFDEAARVRLEALRHPHVIGVRSRNDTVYRGRGAAAKSASDELRLTRPGGPLSQWTVPSWLRWRGLTYHAKPTRWIGVDGLSSAARGQEFVCDIGDDEEAHAWVDRMVGLIRA